MSESTDPYAQGERHKYQGCNSINSPLTTADSQLETPEWQKHHPKQYSLFILLVVHSWGGKLFYILINSAFPVQRKEGKAYEGIKYNIELYSFAFSKLQKSLEIILTRYFKPPVWSASLSKCHSPILEPSMRREEGVYLSRSVDQNTPHSFLPLI